MQAGDAGGLFQNAAALLWLGGDDLADLALAHHGGRTRAGGGVCEQQLHVAGAHFLAVDAIGRARLALDAPGHFQHFGVVEGGRRRAARIVEHEADFGCVAGGAVAGAGEDHVVHAGRTHVLVRVLAHHPAHGFDEIRLAAAIRADDARQSGLDDELRRLAEALETDDAQPVKFHGSIPQLAKTGRRLPDGQPATLLRRHKTAGRARLPVDFPVRNRGFTRLSAPGS